MGNAFPQLTLFMETTCSHELSECQRMLAQMAATLKRVPHDAAAIEAMPALLRWRHGGVAGTAEQTLAIVLEKFLRCLGRLEAAA
jgi:hypothetical protein